MKKVCDIERRAELFFFFKHLKIIALAARSGPEWGRQIEYVQALLAVLVGEGLVAVDKLVELVLSDRKALFCQFICPFLEEVYRTKPSLLVNYSEKLKVGLFCLCV